MTPNVPLKDQISELRREARMRRVAYPRWVATGTLTQQEANRQEERLQAAIDTLEALYMEREQLKLPL
jgi:hypothetical protein